MKKIIIFVLVLAFLLSGCGNSITEGDVYDKEYQEAWTQMMILPMAISNGKTLTTIPVPYFIYHPENYIIKIREYDTKTEKFLYEDFYVHPEVFNKVLIGDRFKFEKDMGWTDEPVVKERAD